MIARITHISRLNSVTKAFFIKCKRVHFSCASIFVCVFFLHLKLNTQFKRYKWFLECFARLLLSVSCTQRLAALHFQMPYFIDAILKISFITLFFLHFCRRIHCKHFSLLFKIIATSFILSDINWVKNKFSFEPTQRTKTLFQLNILNFIIYFFFVCVCGQPEFFYLNASIFYLNTSHFT